ncbi:inhibitor of growth 4 [Paramuricea clavata]|uniref:Inhibitor of growth 4 n=1 Tax=Paramuricea clavata TaxID=317549 RepID=A0A7D9I8U8_PARCT|nr:inhibitor of growth 4 [Paramuricea clavata]
MLLQGGKQGQNKQPLQDVRRKPALRSTTSSPKMCCVCRQGEFGKMIGCDNPICTVKWFHMECVGLSSAPDGDWICTICKGVDMFCLCGQGEYGDMIACDNPTCPVEWFHMGCVGLSSIPDGDWICTFCKADMADIKQWCICGIFKNVVSKADLTHKTLCLFCANSSLWDISPINARRGDGHRFLSPVMLLHNAAAHANEGRPASPVLSHPDIERMMPHPSS